MSDSYRICACGMAGTKACERCKNNENKTFAIGSKTLSERCGMSKYYKAEDVQRLINSLKCYGIPELNLDGLPTIDIVTCEECKCWLGDSEWYEDSEYKRCQNGGLLTSLNHYCAWGERIAE